MVIVSTFLKLCYEFISISSVTRIKNIITHTITYFEQNFTGLIGTFKNISIVVPVSSCRRKIGISVEATALHYVTQALQPLHNSETIPSRYSSRVIYRSTASWRELNGLSFILSLCDLCAIFACAIEYFFLRTKYCLTVQYVIENTALLNHSNNMNLVDFNISLLLPLFFYILQSYI